MSLQLRPVTVLVAGFEDLVSRGLDAVLAEDPALVVVARDVAPAQLDAALHEHAPAVAVLNFGTLASAGDVHRLHAAHGATRLLVLANRPTPAEANQLLAFGATACLSKATQGRDVLTAIHLASRGLHVLPRVSSPDADDRVPATAFVGPDLLTRREGDVLEHLQAGRSNAEIARALCVGLETVRTHRRNIYRKLGIRSRRELGALGAPSETSVRL